VPAALRLEEANDREPRDRIEDADAELAPVLTLAP